MIESVLLVVLAAFIIGVIIMIILDRQGTSKVAGRGNIDRLAVHMATPKDLGAYVGKKTYEKAARLYPAADPKIPETCGVIVGQMVRGKQPIIMSWEDTLVMFAGSRMGKTSSLVSTAIVSAPGAVVATSNKGDIVHATAAARQVAGSGVWIFDPKRIYSQGATGFWFNPLGRVRSPADSLRVASYFYSATTNATQRTDAYFDGSARDLLANTILAAALAGGDIMHVREWMGNPDDETPALILRVSGQPDASRRLGEYATLTPRQRDGVYDMARRFLNALADPEWAATVLPPVRTKISVKGGEVIREIGQQIHGCIEFDLDAFVDSSDTLYALSTSGEDSPAALTTALVGEIFEAAMTKARTQDNGRLPTPLVAVLDEAANVVRLEQLPHLYSYLGSQGIVPLTFLQSPAQGRQVWGEHGLDMMVSTANVTIYGGGVEDKNYLDHLSAFIGDRMVKHVNVNSSSGGGSSRSVTHQRERIFHNDMLKALPSSHQIITVPGARPALARKIFYPPKEKTSLLRKITMKGSENAR